MLTDAIIAASGGYHMTTAALNTSQDAKGFGVIQAEWYLNQNLPVNADFANAEFNYQEFIVAYQELLRGATPWRMIPSNRRQYKCTGERQLHRIQPG